MYALVALLAVAAPPQAPLPPQAPEVRPEPKPPAPEYRWEEFRMPIGDAQQQIKLVDKAGAQVGVWIYEERKYYRSAGGGKWAEEKPPIPPPTTPARKQTFVPAPAYQPVFAPVPVWCSPRG